MHMQLSIILLPLIDRIRDILPDRTEHDALEEHAGLRRLHVRDEDSGGGVTGLRGPFFGRGEGEDAGPGGEGGDDFEGFGEGAGAVGLEEETDSGGLNGEVVSLGYKAGRGVKRERRTLCILRRLWGGGGGVDV